MLLNYIKIGFRNLIKNKIFAFINIFGLAVGMAVFTIIALYAINEKSYDKFNEKIDNIYRLEHGEWGILAPAHSELVKKEILEIKDATRIDVMFGSKDVLKNGKEKFKTSDIIFADASIFNIFTFKFLKGSVTNFKENKFSIILTKSLAKQIFGSKNPVGKVLIFGNSVFDKGYSLTVSGVIDDVKNSHIPIKAIGNFLALPTIRGQKNMLNKFYGANWPTYLLLKKNANPQEIAKKINNLKIYKENGYDNFHLLPLKDIYLKNDAKYEMGAVHGSETMLNALIIMGLFLIIMATINFINLTTAISNLRSKEIGIRKISGGLKSQIIYQFLTEAVVITVISFLFSLFFVDIALPVFNRILDSDLSLSFQNDLVFLGILLTFSIVIGLISGLYPAFFISSHKISQIFRPENKSFLSGGKIRSVLTIIQMTISSFLIFCTIIVYLQLDFFRNKDLGININKTLTLSLNNELKKKQDILIRKLKQKKSIKNISMSNAELNNISWQESRIVNGKNIQFTFNLCDADFFDVYDINFLKGHNFRKNKSSSNVIINEVAMKKFGFNYDNVIGSSIGSGKNQFTVIGLVKDFNFNSLHNPIAPLVSSNLFSKWQFVMNIRLNKNLKTGIADIEKVFKEISPAYEFHYTFVDKNFDNLYKKENDLEKIFLFFSIISILITSLGLFGLTAFYTQRRFKEIGIRKILGAKSFDIIKIVTKPIVFTLIFANIIGITASYIIMNKWLNDFSAHITINFTPYIIGIIISTLISILTVSIIVYKAANYSPVVSLKYE